MFEPSLAIFREPYRAREQQPGSTPTRPDMAVVRLDPALSLPRQPACYYGRDYLWVECKSGSYNTPSGWKNAINEATERLQLSHPTRALGLIMAVGIRCMFFI
jgi:hypothetical protein